MDDVVVGSCQLHAERGPAAPATGAAAAAKVCAWLGAARVALDETAVAQAVVQHNGLGLQELAQFIAPPPASELAVLNILLGQGIGTGVATGTLSDDVFKAAESTIGYGRLADVVGVIGHFSTTAMMANVVGAEPPTDDGVLGQRGGCAGASC